MTKFATLVLAAGMVLGATVAAQAKIVLITGATSSGQEIAVAGVQADASFATLDAALAQGGVAAGDTVYLSPGVDHGRILIKNAAFAAPVIITSVPGSRAKVQSIALNKASNIIFRGLDVWPTVQGEGEGAVIRALSSTSGIVLEDITARSVDVATSYPKWSRKFWLKEKRNGALLEGANSRVSGGSFTGFFNAVQISGADSVIENVTVAGFSGDALRAIGANSTVRNNRVDDCVTIGDAHNDGFQTWSSDGEGTLFAGVLTGITVEGNVINEWSNTFRSRLTCKLQGIFVAGYVDNLLVQNNVVRVTKYHGIAVIGGSNVRIVHNTVVHPTGSPDKRPWINVEAGRDGRPSVNVEIANNIATFIRVDTAGVRQAVTEGNVVPRNMSTEFLSMGGGDLRLSPTATAVDAGVVRRTNAADIAGAKRFRGKAPDAGAYESR